MSLACDSLMGVICDFGHKGDNCNKFQNYARKGFYFLGDDFRIINTVRN